MTKQIKTWQERYHDHPDQEYCMLLEIDELRAELDLLQSDSYDAIWQALQRIETAIVCLPTFEVEVGGGVDACAENIVRAIIKAADILKSKPKREDPEILAEYTGFNGHRQWVKVGAWLHPGDCVAVLSPQSAKREPLSEEQIANAFCVTPKIHQFISAFKAGARFAEVAHGITKGQQ